MKSILVVLTHLRDNDHLITRTGDTFLHWLVRQEILQAVQKVTNNDNINLKNEFSQTPLHVAVKHGNLPIIKFLLDRGACVDIVDKDGNTALHIAAYTKFMDKARLMEILLRFTPHLSKKNKLSQTPLDIVCHKSTRDWKSVELLMMAGAHLNGSNSGWKALYYIKPNSINNENINDSSQYHKIIEVIHLHIQLKLSEDNEWTCDCSDLFIFRNCNNPKWEVIKESIDNKLELYKSNELANTGVTMWDVAVAPLAKVEQMFEDRRVLTAASNYLKETSCKLDALVEKKIQFASRKRNFINSCLPYLQERLEYSLPLLCLEKIIKHLDQRTLRYMLLTYMKKTGEFCSANDMFDSSRYTPISIED